MSMSQNRRLLVIILVFLTLVAGVALVASQLTPMGALSGGAPADSSADRVLRAALRRAQEARAYRYSSEIEQTLIPRPVPQMVGQQDQTMLLTLEGEVQGPEHSRATLQFDPGGISGIPGLRPVTIVRDGAELYAEQEGRRIVVQQDGLPPGVADAGLDYLAAAGPARWLEPAQVGAERFSRIAFELRGADLLRRQAARLAGARPANGVRLPDYYRDAVGSGELWIDEQGLPRRQIISLELPRVSPEYHGRLTMRLTYGGFAGVATAPFPVFTPLTTPPDAPAPVGAAPPAPDLAAVTETVRAWMQAHGEPLTLALAVALLLALARLYFAWHRRSPRRAQAALIFPLAVLLAGQPSMQAAARAHQQELINAAPSLDELLGLPTAAPAPQDPATLQAIQQLQQGNATSGLITKCGDGRADSDSDGDGLSDLDEGCLGTNAYAADSDLDQIPDGVEIRTFTVGGREWSLNPRKTDSNDDGLSDYLEQPPTEVALIIGGAPVTVTLGAAPVNPQSSSPYDGDNDGVPNVWDDDNDGDGVSDRLDLSPYARGSYQDELWIKSSGQGYAGSQYIEVQVQPENPAHLRYGLSVFDWPVDTQGAMQVYRQTDEGSVRLQPFLEVAVNLAALPKTYAKQYNLIIRDAQPGSLYGSVFVPLQRIGSGGAVSAFYAKLAFAPDELASIDLRARIVWMVQGQSQTDDGTIDPKLLHVYRGEKLRLVGMSVTRSERAENFILGHPASPNEDRALAAAAAGMNMFFLGGSTVPTATVGLSPLQELARRFDGVPPAGVTGWAYAWALPADGVYTLQARARDGVGNLGFSPVVSNVIVDGTPPQATLGWSGVRFERPRPDNSILITGSASDNLAGLARVDVSIDGAAFVPTSFTPGLSANWSYSWVLPPVELAQGTHEIRVRAIDRAGNVSAVAMERLVVDTLAPSSDLISRRFAGTPPVVRSGEPITLVGRASDAGNLPLPPTVARLEGVLDALDDAAVRYAPDAPTDGAAGTLLAWAGDIDGDRRADYVVGLPAARGGAGAVHIVYGRSGDFRTPPDMELLSGARATLVGASGAGIGRYVAPVGDVNGDGYNDLLVGDPANQRAFLVFGRNSPLGEAVALTGDVQGQQVALALPLGAGQTMLLAPAGDVNGDGFDDMLIGQAGGTVALLMGERSGLLPGIDVFQAAAATFTLAAGGQASGVDDVNGDGRDDFAVGTGGQVRLYAGSAVFVKNGLLALPAPLASLASSDPNPQIAPLGDLNGDGLADFAYSNGGSPQFVRGRAGGAWGPSFTLAATAGILAGVGDVNRDGRADFMLGTAGGARLYYGAPGDGLPSLAATVQRVARVGAAPLGAGADLNCDASSDLLALPTAAPAPPNPIDAATRTRTDDRLLPALATPALLTTSFDFAGGLALYPTPLSAANVLVAGTTSPAATPACRLARSWAAPPSAASPRRSPRSARARRSTSCRASTGRSQSAGRAA